MRRAKKRQNQPKKHRYESGGRLELEGPVICHGNGIWCKLED